MKTFITGMTCLVSLAAAPALAQQSALHGIWVGGHPAAEGYVMLRMQVGLDSAADDAQASIGIPGMPRKFGDPDFARGSVSIRR